jgi:hypothetical protein
VTAIRVRIEDTQASAYNEGMAINGLALLCGHEEGACPRARITQRVKESCHVGRRRGFRRRQQAGFFNLGQYDPKLNYVNGKNYQLDGDPLKGRNAAWDYFTGFQGQPTPQMTAGQVGAAPQMTAASLGPAVARRRHDDRPDAGGRGRASIRWA